MICIYLYNLYIINIYIYMYDIYVCNMQIRMYIYLIWMTNIGSIQRNGGGPARRGVAKLGLLKNITIQVYTVRA